MLPDGFAVEWAEPGTLLEALRPHYLGGLFHPRDGLLEPGRWSRGLAEFAAGAGVEIHEESRAVALDGTVVRTAGGTVAADVVGLYELWMLLGAQRRLERDDGDVNAVPVENVESAVEIVRAQIEVVASLREPEYASAIP